MSDHALESEHHDHPSYVKIWGILCVLFTISVLGPTLGIKTVTLITAFGIALVKAYLVIKYFMHLTIEPKFIAYLLGTMLTFVALFFFAVAPDVMNHEGVHWENVGAKQEIARREAAPASHHGGGAEHGGGSEHGQEGAGGH